MSAWPTFDWNTTGQADHSTAFSPNLKSHNLILSSIREKDGKKGGVGFVFSI